MDTKGNAADPKLQEAYNRIMATPTQPGQPPVAPAQEGQQNPAASSVFSDQQAGAVRPAPPTPTVFVQQSQMPPGQNPLPSPATAAQVSDISTTLQIVYIVAAVVFFIVYTIFWIKIFNLSTPLPF